MKRFLAIAILLFVAGCSVPNKEVKVFFFKEDSLVPVTRELPTNENPVVIAIDQLLQGPNDSETASGIMTEIPNGTRARKVDVDGDMAIIDLNSRLTEYGGGSAKVRGILAQIVYSATSVKGIKKVLLKLEGSDQFTLGTEGYMIDHPLERKDVKF